ncbi:hypothetical protein LJC54_08790 [Parabacteroides sp. OttesenSCG-928-J18]|nr:hypothetical protein [Parabacteroides sp. OttesenSCG-928-J18]
MKKSCLIAVVLSVLLFSACDNDFDFDDPEHNSGKLRTVRMEKTTIGDGQVIVAWGYNNQYTQDINTKCIMLPDLEPEKFTLYQSFDPDKDFTKVVEFTNRKDPYFEHTIKGLENGKPVYFYVESSRKKYDSEVSLTIMVIPNPEVQSQLIFKESATSDLIDLLRYCPVNNKVAYNTRLNILNKRQLIVVNLDGSGKELVHNNRSLYDICWSSDGNMIVYSTMIGNDKAILVYDLTTKEESILFTLPDKYVFNLAISPDSKKILCTSLENTEEWKYSIRMLDLETKELTTILKRDDYNSLESIDWINNEEFIFEARESIDYYRAYSCIYRASINSDKCENIIRSQWLDTDISLSPDKKRMAFTSTRSGSTQLWVYDIEKKQFNQLTGFDVNQRDAYGISRPGWIDNQTIHYLENARNIRTLSID